MKTETIRTLIAASIGMVLVAISVASFVGWLPPDWYVPITIIVLTVICYDAMANPPVHWTSIVAIILSLCALYLVVSAHMVQLPE